tara:strand:+ start:352 stop:660 length:309 start_codon:yes stop_codon:yes gene_type:complete
MIYDHEAIQKAYPNAALIADEQGVFDENGTKIDIEQNKVDAARVELNKLKYRHDRVFGGSVIYGSYGEQMAMIYDDIIAGKLDSTGSFAAHNKAVKDANPKP